MGTSSCCSSKETWCCRICWGWSYCLPPGRGDGSPHLKCLEWSSYLPFQWWWWSRHPPGCPACSPCWRTPAWAPRSPASPPETKHSDQSLLSDCNSPALNKMQSRNMNINKLRYQVTQFQPWVKPRVVQEKLDMEYWTDLINVQDRDNVSRNVYSNFALARVDHGWRRNEGLVQQWDDGTLIHKWCLTWYDWPGFISLQSNSSLRSKQSGSELHLHKR